MGTRRERVILELEDSGFSTGMAKDAALTAVLNRELKGLSGRAVESSSATRSLERDVDRLGTTTGRTERNVDKLGKTAGRSEKDIDKLSGRIRILGQVVSVIGPAAVPISAVAIPAISGLTSVLGFLTTGIGASAFAFKGLGDVMQAVSKARTDPTQKNLDDLRVTLAGLTPETRAFVAELRTYLPILDELQGTAAAGLFPGLREGLQEAKEALPQVEAVISAITTKVGEIGADAGKSLADGDWDEFFEFIGTEGPAALEKMASAAGHLTHGLAGLWMSTTPLNNDFLDWLDTASARFDKWSNDLGQTKGFHDFVAYVREVGPEVGETFGAIGNALVQVTQAVAPLGGPSLQIIQALADAIAKIADSPIGTPLLGFVAAMAALNLGTRTYASLQQKTFGSPAATRIRSMVTALDGTARAQERLTVSTIDYAKAEKDRSATVREGRNALAQTGSQLGLLAFQSSGAADKLHLTNTASLALAGSFAGPWGTAIGGAVGGLMDLSSALTGANEGTADLQHKIDLLVASAGSDKSAQIDALSARIKQLKAAQDQEPDFSLSRIPRNLIGDLNPFDDGRSSSQKEIDALTAKRKELQNDVSVNDAFSHSQGNAAKGMDALAASARAQVSALNAARSAGQSINQTFLNYGDTLGDTKKTLDQFIDNFVLKAKALSELGRNTQTALDRGLNENAIEWFRSKGPDGALRLQQLAHGAQGDIEKMNKAWRQFAVAGRDNVKAGLDVQNQLNATKQSAKDLANKRYMLQIDADTRPAWLKTAALIERIKGLSVNIAVGAVVGGIQPPKVAEGGSVPKTGLPYADRHLYMLADGEEIISNRYGQADRFRSDRAAGRIPGYGNGGEIGQLLNTSSSSGSSGGSKGGSTGKTKAKKKKRNVLTRQEYQEALSSLIDGLNSTLGLTSTGPAAEVHQAFQAFATQIRKDGGNVGHQFDVIESRLVKVAGAYKDQQDLLDRAQSIRDSIASNYRSNIFASSTPSSVWMSNADRAKAGTGDVFSALTGDISHLDALTIAEKQLKVKGLDSKAYADLVSNASLDQIQAFANGSNADVMRYERLFNQRELKLATAGNVGASAAFGAAIAANTAQLAEARKLTAGINRVAALLEKNPHATSAALAAALQSVIPKRGRG